jgi:hypothetical protein
MRTRSSTGRRCAPSGRRRSARSRTTARSSPSPAHGTSQDWPWAIAVDDNNVYWTNYDNDALTGSSSPTILASSQDQSFGIALDGTNVYWTGNDNTPSGNVSNTPLPGGTGSGTVTKLATNIAFPTAIAVDPVGVFYTGNGGRVWRLTPP